MYFQLPDNFRINQTLVENFYTYGSLIRKQKVIERIMDRTNLIIALQVSYIFPGSDERTDLILGKYR